MMQKRHSSHELAATERARRNRLLLVGLLLLLPVLACLFLFFGRYPQAGWTPPGSFWEEPLLRLILTQIRIPRILLALMAGAVLAGSGFVFQMIFANPLVEPNFLGVSQGAAFGASLVIVGFGYAPVWIQVSAAGFGMSGLLLSWALARRFRFGGWILRLVLAGIAVSAIFSSALAFLKLVAEPTRDLQDITFWMMGGFWNITPARLLSILPAVLFSLVVVFCYRWRLNLLSLNDRTAHSVGMIPIRDKTILLAAATIGTTAVISVSGLIGWVGLIIPHLARRVFGADSRHALPGAILIGALFLLLCDTVARTLFASEIPIGLLTSILGAFGFIFILIQRRGGLR
ncbi:MAG: iron ABC transporter permease [Verrucomicrobiota bacterium]|jgi:iron complex transport system permease protein|nr:iron ABC transporter permease [Verrucomicrobiota bacterium]